MGALIGGPARTDPDIASCQLASSASTTAVGLDFRPVAGYTTLATPAASEAASPPPTRMVFRAALAGKPSLAAALLSPDLAPSCGGAFESLPMLQPPSAPAHASSASGAVLLLHRATGGGR